MTPRTPKLYDGPVVFAAGVHYPVGDDSHADLTRPLRFDVASGKYRDAEADEPLHNDVHHVQDLEPAIGSEG